MKRVVILMQENKTPDFYFPTHLAAGERRGQGNGGARIAAPNDAVVRAKPPKLPAGL